MLWWFRWRLRCLWERPGAVAIAILAIGMIVSFEVDRRQDRDDRLGDRNARVEAFVAAEVSGCRQENSSRRLVANAVVQLSVSLAETNAEALESLVPIDPDAVAAYVRNARLDGEAVAALYPLEDCDDVAAEARATADTVEQGH